MNRKRDIIARVRVDAVSRVHPCAVRCIRTVRCALRLLLVSALTRTAELETAEMYIGRNVTRV